MNIPTFRPLVILDSAGVDLRMVPQPLVFEHDSLAPFFQAGGWIDTVPDDLGADED